MVHVYENLWKRGRSAVITAGLVFLPAATVSAAATSCCGVGMLAALTQQGCSGCGGGHAGHGSAPAPTEAPAKKSDADLVKEQKAIYPLTTCVVSGEKLGGSMGEPVDYLHKDRLVRFCCKGCIEKFQKDPDKYLKVLDAAVVKEQKEKYPLTTCVVSGEKLGDMGEPIDYVYQGRLVRFCCKGCVREFGEKPGEFMKKLGSGAAKSAPADDPHAGHQH
ncbi:hypothetical protein HS125_07655 [bacterium]|nr:hypothetical protein [bacterium]